METALALISDIDRAIAKIETLEQAVDTRDVATAAYVFLSARGLEAEAQRAKALLLRTERKAGQMLREMDKAKPWATRNVGSREEPTLDDLGITKKESYCWQHMALVAEDDFREYISSIDKGKEITRSGVLMLLSARGQTSPKTNLDVAGDLIRQLIAVMRKMDEQEVGYVKGLLANLLSGSDA